MCGDLDDSAFNKGYDNQYNGERGLKVGELCLALPAWDKTLIGTIISKINFDYPYIYFYHLHASAELTSIMHM